MSKTTFVQRLLNHADTLRSYRKRRSEALPFGIRLAFVRNKIRKEVHEFWSGGYVYSDDGKLVYVPAPLDVMGGYRLLKPPRPNRFVPAFLKPGDVVVDVGANMGDWALAAAQVVGAEGVVLAFEPTPHVASALTKTARINRLKQLLVFDMALAEQDGEMEFSIERENTGGSRIGVVRDDAERIYHFKRHFTQVVVKTRTLDHVVAERGIDKVDVIKVDVEGFEISVLKGALETIRRHRPSLYLETGHESREARREIAELLRPLGYEIIGVEIAAGMIEATWDEYIDASGTFAGWAAGRAMDMLLMSH